MKAKARSTAWYTLPAERVHEAVHSTVTRQRRDARSYRDQTLHHMRLYVGSSDLAGDGLRVVGDGKLRYNIVSSTIETAAAIVCATTPVPLCQVRGGDWDLQRRGQLRTQVLTSQMAQLGMARLQRLAFVDACTAGIGWIYFGANPDSGLPFAERCLPLEVTWDRAGATSGAPRSLYRTRLIDRDVLRALYPAHTDAIDKADGASVEDLSDFAITRDDRADQVAITEAWHLPSSSKASDGRYALCVSSKCLVSRPWKRARFPFAACRWAPRQVGLLGKALAEEARPAQRQIAAMLEHIEQLQALGSTARIFVEGNSRVEPEMLTNLPLQVIRYFGAQPTMEVVAATPPDLEPAIDRIRERLWSQLGLNASQSEGAVPAGVTSAVGLRMLESIGSRRQQQNIRMFEEFATECANCLADVNDDVAAAKPDFAVDRTVRSRFLETSKWADLAVGEGDVRMTVFPTSSLPTEPAGRAQTLDEWVLKGWIQREFALQLQSMGDLESFTNWETADLQFVDWQMSRLRDPKAGPVTPDEHCNLDLAIDRARRLYLLSAIDGAPAEVLSRITDYIAYGVELQSRVTPTPQSPGIDPMPQRAPQAPGPEMLQ